MSNIRKRNVSAKENQHEGDNSSRYIRRTESHTSCSAVGLCLKIFISSIGLIAIVAAIGYFRSPFTAKPTSDFAKQVKLVGVLKVNKKLSQGTKKTVISGPESIEEDGMGNLYTGLEDGRIIRIAPSSDGIVGAGDITNITNGVIVGASTSVKGATHGRPLGVRLRGDTLFVADAVYGLYSVNLNSRKVTLLVSPDSIDPPLGFADDLCLSKDGHFIYFSDASSKYTYYSVGHFILEGLCDGRLLQYNVRTKQVRTVVSEMCFANGVQISNDEKVIFVSESFKYRIRIVDLMTWEIKSFVDVPIFPDNIRPSGKGTYWIAGASLWTPFYGFVERFPIFRQIMGGITSETFFAKLSNKRHGALVEMSEDGELLQALHDPTGEMTFSVTQATPLKDGRLALGSFVAEFLGFSSIRNPASKNNDL